MRTAKRLGVAALVRARPAFVIAQFMPIVLMALLVGLPATVSAQSQSSDATLSGLTLSGIDFGTFASGTTSYSAQVANTVSQTTVTPTVNHSGATYVIKLGGVVDADRVIALDAGSNVITVEVTAEDDSTTKTYTVTVTRAAAPISAPDLDITFVYTFSNPYGYSPSFTLGVNVKNQGSGASGSTTLRYYRSTDSAITSGDAEVGTDAVDGLAASEISRETIDLIAPSAPGTYYYGACVDAVSDESDTTNNCSGAIAWMVPAETSTDATLSALTLSGINFGAFSSATTSYTASVANSVTETTVTPTVNHSGATYVIKLGGVVDADRVIALSVGSNVITVEVTAEDDSTTKTYAVTVTRAAAPISAPDLVVPFVSTFTNLYRYDPSFTLGVNVVNQGSGASGSTTLRYYRSADSTITSGDTEVGTDAVGGLAASGRSIEGIDLTAPSAPGTYYYGACVDAVSNESNTTNNCSPAIAFTVPAETSTDATLSALTLSDVPFGTFASGTTSYTAQVANSVTETTVTPTVNDTGATYVIKLGGVTDADGVVSLSVGSNVITIEVTAEDDTTTRTYTVTVTRLVSLQQKSTDATLSALTLSGINFGAFSSATTSYTASVANSVSQTTVTPTVNDSGATYVIKLGGVTDADGVVSLSVGSNVITIEVTAEDDTTTRTYTVTVTRLVSLQQKSTDATLSGLTLSEINIGTFASGTTSYTASVANSVSQTTVTPTVNDSGATYVIKLGGVTDADSVVSLSVGSNVITIKVTAEDDETTQTYTVAVTRAEPPSTDATLSALTLSGIDFGTFASGTTSYSAQVANTVSQTTVTPTVNHSGATYVIKLGGVVDADRVIALSVGSNVITVEVTAEDDSTTKTYTVTVTRAAAPISAPDLDITFVYTFSNPYGYSPSFTLGVNVKNQGSGASGSTTLRYYRSTDSAITSGDAEVGTDAVDGLAASEISRETIDLIAPSAPGTYYYGACVDAVSDESDTTNNCSGSVAWTVPGETSTDATLSALTLSDVPFGTFASGTTSYTAQVANSVTETTVTPTVNDSGATYVIKLGGVTDADGVVALSVGSNVITVEVTAEDDSTTKTYTVTVTRAEPPSTDATLSALTLSGIDFGTFASGTASYGAQVANSVSQTTVAPTVKHSGASYVIKLGGVTDADGVVSLSVGSNVITVEVTAEDDDTTRTYTVAVTRAAPPSTDATLSALSLSGIEFGTFDSSITTYSAQVANSVSQTTVTPTVNDSGASYVIKLGGVTDADGVVLLSVGSNAITVEVTAEDDSTTKTYTVTVTRAEPPSTDATLSALTLSDVLFGTFASGTTSYSAQVASSVSQTTVTPTLNHSGAGYVIKLDGVTDVDGVVSLSVGSNVITVEVSAEDDQTTQTYTVTISRAEPPTIELSDDATLSSLTLSGIDFGTFDSTTTSYTAQVANAVSQSTVTLTVNHAEANYVIKLGGVTDADGVVSLSVGTNAISVEVTAEDGETTHTYTVTVTRAAPPSTDATLSALSLSGIDLGTFASGTTSYSAQVANSVTETTVTPTVNDSGATYVIKLGGVVDADRVIALDAGSNVITIEVTAEDDSTTKTYAVTVTRAAAPISAPDLVVPFVSTFTNLYRYDPSFTLGVNVVNQGSGASGSTTLRYYRSADSTITSGDTEVGTDAVGGLAASGRSIEGIDLTAPSAPGTYYYGACVDAVSNESNTTNNCSPAIAFTVPAETSTDATLSGLSLTDVNFGTFASGTTAYSAQVANSVTETTVTPTVNHSGATYVIKLGGVTDADGMVSLSVGSNVITVEVTAEDDSTTKTYTVTVTRAAPESNVEMLRDLYDSNDDGVIDRDETVAAIRDYFAGDLTRDETIEVIKLYFSSST